MDTTNSNDKSKPGRRRGRLAEEIAKGANVSLYLAKQALKLRKDAPELAPFVERGELRLRQVFALMKHAPELIPYVVEGKLPCAKCDVAIRLLRQLAEPELTFEEEVERSFRRWLAKWPKGERREVLDIVEFMPLAKLVDLIPSENLGVEIDPEMNQTKTKKAKSK